MGDIDRIGVVGCGTIGAGVAEVCARAGLDVVVSLPGDARASRGRTRFNDALAHRVARSRMTPDECDAIVRRVSFVPDVTCLGDRQLVIEAVPEHMDVKVDVIRRLDDVLTDDDAIVSSVTSSIAIGKLAKATARPERMVGTHFFNPVRSMPLVEVVASLRTEEAYCDRVSTLLSSVLGKQVIRSADRSGFVVNALLVPYLFSAVRMLDSGFASAEDIDSGMTLGCGHPMGPLALSDLIGLDTLQAVGDALYEEFREPSYAPPPLLRRMVEAGQLGRKSGQGFHTH